VDSPVELSRERVADLNADGLVDLVLNSPERNEKVKAISR